MSSAADPFSILTVCTGNICRSPVAERLLSAGLGPGVVVASAGTGAVVGHPISEPMLPHLESDGVTGAGFAARQLTSRHVQEADLILALTADHRLRTVRLAPAGLQRSFTLLEFARIVSAPEFPALPAGAPAQRLRAMTSLAGRHRRLGRTAAGDDVPDPYRRGESAYGEAFHLIRDAVAEIVRVARG